MGCILGMIGMQTTTNSVTNCSVDPLPVSFRIRIVDVPFGGLDDFFVAFLADFEIRPGSVRLLAILVKDFKARLDRTVHFQTFDPGVTVYFAAVAHVSPIDDSVNTSEQLSRNDEETHLT